MASLAGRFNLRPESEASNGTASPAASDKQESNVASPEPGASNEDVTAADLLASLKINENNKNEQVEKRKKNQRQRKKK